MLRQVLLTLFGLALASCMEIDFNGCTPETRPDSVDMSPCTSLPCEFKKGQTVDVKIKFNANADSKTLAAKAYGDVEGVWVPYGLPQPDACTDSGIDCPLVNGQTYNYDAKFPVLKEYPAIKLLVKWELVGDDGNEICFSFPMSIVDADEE